MAAAKKRVAVQTEPPAARPDVRATMDDTFRMSRASGHGEVSDKRIVEVEMFQNQTVAVIERYEEEGGPAFCLFVGSKGLPASGMGSFNPLHDDGCWFDIHDIPSVYALATAISRAVDEARERGLFD